MGTQQVTFKVGDRLRCVSGSRLRSLVTGHEYAVIEVDEYGWVMVTGFGQWCAPDRFELIQAAEAPKCPCTREQDCEACSTQPASPYVTLGSTIGRLVTEKQAAYGDSFGKAHRVIEILYEEDLKRGGIPPEKLPDLLTMVRVIDKQFRIATARDALGETPWRDMAGYSLLAAERAEQQRKNNNNKEAA